MAIDHVEAPARVAGRRRLLGAAAGGTSLAMGLGALALAAIPLAMINEPDVAAKIIGSIFGALFSVSGIVCAGLGLIAGLAGLIGGSFGMRVLSVAGLIASGFGLQLSLHLLDRIN